MPTFRPLLRQRAIAPTTAGLIAAGIALYPKTTLHAEAPERLPYKKPIYSNYEPSPTIPSSNKETAITQPKATPKSTLPTPTDRLATQIGRARIFFHAHVSAAETKLNEVMDSALSLEHSFTSTIASLAPSPATGEKLMPGTLYVLVAAMTGSIISRRRNILLRGTIPIAVGVGAAWLVLPVTMRNVSDLIWTYEKRFPVVADGHVRTRESVKNAWRMARVHGEQAVRVVDEKVTDGREAVEGWVRKGR